MNRNAWGGKGFDDFKAAHRKEMRFISPLVVPSFTRRLTIDTRVAARLAPLPDAVRVVMEGLNKLNETASDGTLSMIGAKVR